MKSLEPRKFDKYLLSMLVKYTLRTLNPIILLLGLHSVVVVVVGEFVVINILCTLFVTVAAAAFSFMAHHNHH